MVYLEANFLIEKYLTLLGSELNLSSATCDVITVDCIAFNPSFVIEGTGGAQICNRSRPNCIV